MSDRDPAVRIWEQAIQSQLDDSALSTSAYARRLEAAVDRARADFSDELLRRSIAERELAEVRQAAERNVERLAYARSELAKALRRIAELEGRADG